MQDHFKKHGVFSWNELMTTDLESAKDFYSKVFGWTFEETPMECGGVYICAKKDDLMLAGMYLKNENVPEHVPPHWGAYVTVDDVDASAAEAEKAGATIVYPLTDIPGVGRMCVIQDPQGAIFSIITYSGESE